MFYFISLKNNKFLILYFKTRKNNKIKKLKKMFNLYTYEKKKKLENKRKRELKKSYSEKKIHSLLTNQLVKGYNSRINHFLLDMVKKPFIVREYLPPMENSRKQYLEEQNNKIIGPKKYFVLKQYISDKERIEKLLEEKKINNQYMNNNKILSKANNDAIKIKDNNIKEQSKKHYIIQQPKMRFRPRTDLERIVDSLNSYSYMKEYSELVRKQLKNLEINSLKKMILKEESFESSTSELSSSFDEIRVKSEISIDSNSISNSKKKEKKKKKTKGRILVNPKMAKQLLREYHIKTHFKGATALAENFINPELKEKEDFLYKKIKGLNNEKKNNKSLSKHKLFSKSVLNFNQNKNRFISEREIYQQINDNNQLNSFINKFPIDEKNFDIVKANPLLYSVSKKIDKNYGEENLQEKLDYLKEIKVINKKRDKKKLPFYYQKIQNGMFNTNKGNNNDDKEEDKEDRVWVYGKAIPISKMDEIANYVLKMCNYNHTIKK